MKSKTSESFIASESNGVKRDQQLRQKQLKRGKECFLRRVELKTIILDGIWRPREWNALDKRQESFYFRDQRMIDVEPA